jgi:putative tryptophan/tyrosine transport system substrate-binding protein
MAATGQSRIERRLAANGIRRREFIALLGGAAIGCVNIPNALSSKVYRVGLVFSTSPVAEMTGSEPVHPIARTLVHALRRLGYVEGENLILERRSAEGHFERYREIFADLVRLDVDVIVTVTTPMALEAKAVTRTVPIVMAGTSTNPVEAGVVNSLARPGGNITGISSQASGELGAKRLGLLKECLPEVVRVAYLSTNQDWEAPYGLNVRAAAQLLHLTLIPATHTPTDYKDAFALIADSRTDALFVSPDSYQYANRKLIVDFARKIRLPDIHVYSEAAKLGALMSYGVDVPDLYRHAASYVDKILKGAKPADLPIEQPTKYELVINLKTAKAIGLTIPPALLARADEVIE